MKYKIKYILYKIKYRILFSKVHRLNKKFNKIWRGF